MTKEEFEGEVRRVLVALELNPQRPVEIRERAATPTLPTGYFATIQEDDYQFAIARYGPGSHLHLQAADDMTELRDTGSVFFQEFKMHLGVSKGQERHLPLMLRVLVRLDYDVDALCAQNGISLTAHEKLEWGVRKQEGESK